MRDGTQRLIDDGRVACPRDGVDVDIERCYTCPWLRGLRHVKNGDGTVYCDFRLLKTLWY